MKKGLWVFVIIFVLTLGGIKTAHAYSRKKSVSQNESLTIKIKPITSNSKEITETTETSERKQAETTKTQSNKTENSSVANVANSPQNEEEIDDLYLETPHYKEDVIIEEVYEEIEEIIHQTPEVEQLTQENHNGVSYLGYDYELGYFSGFDYLPPWTNTVYQWTNFPNHYLIEKSSYPGQTIFGLQIGSTVMIEGLSYTVYDIVYNHPNNQEALDMVIYSGASASMQVCVSADDDANLNLYFLK